MVQCQLKWKLYYSRAASSNLRGYTFSILVRRQAEHSRPWKKCRLLGSRKVKWRPTTKLHDKKQTNWYLQCTKHKYFKEVDINTSFFHSLVKWNNKRREIIAVEKSDGEITSTLNKVMHEFTNHFQNLLNTREGIAPTGQDCLSFGKVITPKQQTGLVR